MKKKIVSLIAIVIIIFTFAGCESEVNLFYYPGEEVSVYVAEIAFSKPELETLNKSGQINGARHDNFYLEDFVTYTGQYWTVEQYIKTLFKYSTDFAYNGKSETDNFVRYSFTLEVLNEADTFSKEAAITVDENLFMYTVTTEQEFPFAKVRKEYDNPTPSGSKPMDIITGGWTEFTVTTNAETKAKLLTQGWTQVSDIQFSRKLMPSFKEAFPIAASDTAFNPDMLKLNYILQTNSKLLSSGEVKIDNTGRKYYYFESSFKENESTILYQYKRANTIGWNLVSMALGLLTVGVIILIAKYSKKKQAAPKRTNAITAAKDLFPYDPMDPFDEYKN